MKADAYNLRESWKRTAGPSTPLRSGPTARRGRRDDKVEGGVYLCIG